MKVVGDKEGYQDDSCCLDEYNEPRVSLTRTSISAIALAAVFGGLSMIAIAQPDADNPTEAPEANVKEWGWGAESHGLRCRVVPVSPAMDSENADLSVVQVHFGALDDMTFAVEIQNVSDHPIKFRDIRYGSGFAKISSELLMRTATLRIYSISRLPTQQANLLLEHNESLCLIRTRISFMAR